MYYLNIIYNLDCIEGLRKLLDNSVDAIVTDPPYELGFMGKKWDSTGIAYNVDMWKECFRVLKHGGHLLSFGGTRTYHRMACAIEDAGFEIRDQIQWIYSNGFPKSQNISKMIDKKFGAEREVIGKRVHPTLKNKPTVKSRAFHVETLDSDKNMESWDITAPATDEAKQWDGWGTSLKPAHEPIVMARKPLSEKTIVDNVLTWNTGGINIDGSRVPYQNEADLNQVKAKCNFTENAKSIGFGTVDTLYGTGSTPLEQARDCVKEDGRFPANIIFDEEAGKILDEQSGITKTGGASRFFYCAKASGREKGKFNNHPTVKPIKLMEYLVRLVTPKGGTVLDPFAGSGTTLLAAKNLGFNYIGIEKEKEYIEIIEKRLG